MPNFGARESFPSPAAAAAAPGSNGVRVGEPAAAPAPVS
jgi:hypothetical protein